MSALSLLLPAALAALLDLTVFSGMRVLGGHPSISVALVAAWSMLRRREEAMVLAPATGLLLGLLGNEPLGASVLGLAVVALLALQRDPSSVEGRFANTLIVSFAGMVLYTGLLALADAVVAHVAPSPVDVARQMGVGAALTTVLTAMLYLPMTRFARQTREPGRFRRP